MSVKNVPSKYAQAADDLENRLKNGQINLKDGLFYTRREIAEQYHVAPLTAYRVLKKLEQDGYIRCGQGKRATLVRNRAESAGIRPEPGKLVCVVIPNYDHNPLSTVSWIIRYVQEQLARNTGTRPLLVSIDDARDIREWGVVQGVIGFELMDSSRRFYDMLRLIKKPFVAISYTHLEPNVLCVMPRYFIVQASLYMMRQKVKRILIFRSCAAYFENYMIESEPFLYGDSFRAHGYDVEIIRTSPVANLNEKTKAYICEQLDFSAGVGRIGIHTRSVEISEFIIKEMKARGKILGKDYAMVTYGVTPGTRPPSPYVDFHCAEIGDQLIATLKRQLNAGVYHDLGGLVVPTFVEQI